ncbi:hypothetical protein [Actinokineospora sp. HUAS TT18]|uniref:hypothetical protein n=1 Tax=Actinokineospora sp. HUAS TT18 TaxID=3447451 RepID=UPI003F5256DD
MLRWTLATILLVAAVVNAYLAMAESVLWPVVPALVWALLAAALLTPEPKPDIPEPRAEVEPVRRPAHV